VHRQRSSRHLREIRYRVIRDSRRIEVDEP
jgi:hypothetical protein